MEVCDIFFHLLQHGVCTRNCIADIRDEAMVYQFGGHTDGIRKPDLICTTMRLNGDMVQPQKHRPVIVTRIDMPTHGLDRIACKQIANT